MAILTDQRIVFLNALANRPGIIEALAPGYRNIDLTAFFSRDGNRMLGDEHGVMLFAMREPGTYEAHYLMPSRTDEQRIVEICRGFIKAMFTEHGAQTIVVDVPTENLPARSMTRALGFMPAGSSVSASGRQCMSYKLERLQWATS